MGVTLSNFLEYKLKMFLFAESFISLLTRWILNLNLLSNAINFYLICEQACDKFLISGVWRLRPAFLILGALIHSFYTSWLQNLLFTINYSFKLMLRIICCVDRHCLLINDTWAARVCWIGTNHTSCNSNRIECCYCSWLDLMRYHQWL